jgi:O-acetyl-ADP-ribose deacetylase (regulator of RNase III)
VLVYNLATQIRPGRDARLDAIESAMEATLHDLGPRGVAHLGVPRLGAGIGGLEGCVVEVVLGDLAEASPVDLVVVTPPSQGNDP